MKILLVGEFSGVQANFKKGLELLGHSVTCIHDGDGFKRFHSDLSLAPFKARRWLIPLDLYHLWKIRRVFTGNDIVCFVHSNSIPIYYKMLGLLKYIRSNNRVSVYYACGTDKNFLRSHGHFDYFPFTAHECEALLRKKDVWYRNILEARFFDNIDWIIPSCYNYAVGYSGSEKLTRPVQFPSKKRAPFCAESVGPRRRILFGITRKSFKGADIILHALDMLSRSHGPLVEIKIVERLSFENYLDELKNADILIDQCKSYDYGMNALLGMEYSAIVLSGAESDSLAYSGESECPVINIKPDALMIYDVLVSLIDMADEEFIELKKFSFDFVRSYHDSRKVAEKFLSVIAAK